MSSEDVIREQLAIFNKYNNNNNNNKLNNNF